MQPDQSTSQDENNQGLVLINLEQMIKSHISGISQLEEEIQKQQGIIDDILNNDSTYKEHDKKAKEASKLKSMTKSQILKQPQAADLAQKVANSRGELKQMQEALSDYLKEYQRLSGVNEIEGDDGEVREIIYTAKLVKKFTPHR